jgi:hypothetical protein
MSLPAGQQRILDGIADGLQASEPRLATMYAIFTRLTKSEARPRREQLPVPPRWSRWLGHFAAPLPVRRWRRLRRSRRRLSVVAPIAIVVIALPALIGLTSYANPACGAVSPRASTVASARHGCLRTDGAGYLAK